MVELENSEFVTRGSELMLISSTAVKDSGEVLSPEGGDVGHFVGEEYQRDKMEKTRRWEVP